VLRIEVLFEGCVQETVFPLEKVSAVAFGTLAEVAADNVKEEALIMDCTVAPTGIPVPITAIPTTNVVVGTLIVVLGAVVCRVVVSWNESVTFQLEGNAVVDIPLKFSVTGVVLEIET
jgi:hypothetical protein